MNRKHYAIARNSTWPILSFTSTIQAIRILSPTYQIYGYGCFLPSREVVLVADRIQQQYSLDHIPAVFVATKSDLDLAQQVSPPVCDLAL